MRARNIKPGFFVNSQLAKCEAFARLLFTGLWCAADRDGKLKDDPLGIKMKILPADNVDCDSLLQQLHDSGLIVRYEVNGEKYILIKEFSRHQKPHAKEVASTIPSPEENDKPQPRYDPVITKEEVKHILGNGEFALNPESLLLNPSSLNPECGILNPECSTTVENGAREFVLPDWVPKEPWDAFMETRKGLKARNTSRALNSLVKELEKLRERGHDPTEVIDQSIRNSWKDVFEIRNKHNANTSGNSNKNLANGYQQGQPDGKSKWRSEAERLAAKYRAEAQQCGEGSPESGTG